MFTIIFANNQSVDVDNIEECIITDGDMTQKSAFVGTLITPTHNVQYYHDIFCSIDAIASVSIVSDSGTAVVQNHKFNGYLTPSIRYSESGNKILRIVLIE